VCPLRVVRTAQHSRRGAGVQRARRPGRCHETRGRVYNPRVPTRNPQETEMRTLCGAAIALTLCTSAWAQTTVHQHYAKDARTEQPASDGRMAPRLQSLGSHKFPVTTKSADAQKFIDQGMNLSYGFNHAEAGRAFAEAARLDPKCAMAYWGQA